MKKRIDISGSRFGRLTALVVVGEKNGCPLWKLACDCGGEAFGIVGQLRIGKPRSCGCLKLDTAKAQGLANRRHGGAAGKDRLYRIWAKMKQRCFDRNDPAYVNYGGRGIFVCDAWSSSYEAFRHWALESGYSYSLTIDRIDNSAGYSADNCRWATYKEQNNNRRSNRVIEVDGEKKTITEWSNITGVRQSTILYRVKSGKSCRAELFKPGYKEPFRCD